MKKFFLISILSIPSLLIACISGNFIEKTSIIHLQADSLEAYFLPDVGGRLVFLARTGGENLLKSDPMLWNEDQNLRSIPSPEAGWKAYNGHIIWPGPQSEWWVHQDLNPGRRDRAASWPPDPYLIYSTYHVVKQTSKELIMESPPSPLTGISLTKKYMLSNSGLEIEVKMTNTSDKVLSWDIWSNTRFDGKTLFFVPDCAEGILRISSNDSGDSALIRSELVEGAFTLTGNSPGPGERRRNAKAFLHPGQGRIVAVLENTMLVIGFDFVEPAGIHPEQGFVEIYKELTPGGKGDLLELEHHSAYVSLQPGESNTLTETWTLYEYPGKVDPVQAIRFYKRIVH